MMSNSNEVKRVLFPVGDREAVATDWRLFSLVKRLVRDGCEVDIVTYGEEVFQRAKQMLDGCPGVNFMYRNDSERFWTMAQRDSFAQTFIKLNHDLVVPGMDFKYWKMVGFDDFLWNTSSNVFPEITKDYDVLLFPTPSFEEPPSTKGDVFYTHMIFHAKENNIPIVALQIYPVNDTPPIYHKMLDHYLVREDYEKDYYWQCGIDPERITVIDDIKDNYSISTIQDSYKALTLNDSLDVPRDHIGIMLVNHGKNRAQLHEIIEAIGEVDVPKSVFFVFLQYAVKELHEQDIFNDLTKPILERVVKNFYTVETGAMIKALMLCDVVVSTNYIVPLSFAGQYGKAGVVYNPLKTEILNYKDVCFTNSIEALKEEILKQYERKQNMATIPDVIKEIA